VLLDLRKASANYNETDAAREMGLRQPSSGLRAECWRPRNSPDRDFAGRLVSTEQAIRWGAVGSAQTGAWVPCSSDFLSVRRFLRPDPDAGFTPGNAAARRSSGLHNQPPMAWSSQWISTGPEVRLPKGRFCAHGRLVTAIACLDAVAGGVSRRTDFDSESLAFLEGMFGARVVFNPLRSVMSPVRTIPLLVMLARNDFFVGPLPSDNGRASWDTSTDPGGP